MIKLKFKTPTLRTEWPCVYQPLRVAIMELLDFVAVNFDEPQELVITCCYRSPDYNKREGGHPRSLHMTNPTRAVDIRNRSLKDNQQQAMKSYWDETMPASWKFVIESDHIHVQANRPRKS